MFGNANRRHNFIWNEWKNKVNWIDFCNIFTSEPIYINGAKKYGLKEVADAMFDHKLISSTWNNIELKSGLHAMMNAVNYYKYVDNNDNYCNDNTKTNLGNEFQNIVTYNEQDCKAVCEIVNYLRNNNC